jgi:DNA polymerase-3 subunit gamma/tau
MRDAQSAFDQVIAFAGSTIAADDVTSVLGLVRRDLLLDVADAVADEDATAMFALAGRAVESGYELRSVVRELARLARDLMLVKIDPSRATDPEIAAEGERDRMTTLAPRFSIEDLMRAFDLLSKAEFDIRASAHPRYHLEMALLRWIHLRKLVPLSELIEGIDKSAPSPARSTMPGARGSAPSAPPRAASGSAAVAKAVEARREATVRPPASPVPSPAADVQPVAPDQLKQAFLDEVRKSHKLFYGTVFAMAQKIDLDGDRVVFTFGPHQRVLRVQLDQRRSALEEIASRLAGRRMSILSIEGSAAPAPSAGTRQGPQVTERQAELKQQALEDSGVQAMLDVFAAEIKDVEER